MRVKLRYKGKTYQLDGNSWRGPDGRIVHLLTWITDDLERFEPSSGAQDPALTARRVAERLGQEAELILEPVPPWAS